MAVNEKINLRVSELINKYSNPSNSVEQLLCDQYPSNKLAYKIINEKPELVIATISASDTSLLMAYIVEKKAATGITK